MNICWKVLSKYYCKKNKKFVYPVTDHASFCNIRLIDTGTMLCLLFQAKKSLTIILVIYYGHFKDVCCQIPIYNNTLSPETHMRVGEGGWVGVNTFYYKEIAQQSISYDWKYITWPLVLLLLFIRFNSVILFINTCAFFFSIFHLYEWDFFNCIEHLHVLHVFQSNPLKYKWILKRIVDMVYVHE